MVINSMNPCALWFEVTGSKDDKASFFDEVKKTSDSTTRLENQMMV